MICDASALNAFQTLTREEGIIPALESSHAVAWVLDHAEELPQGGDVLVNLRPRRQGPGNRQEIYQSLSRIISMNNMQKTPLQEAVEGAHALADAPLFLLSPPDFRTRILSGPTCPALTNPARILLK